ncbi:MAG TPA: BlaI/MecI/CopY family transcriptional regulator [Planctomycetota bacterium]|nr:BlaI/MecI/CopY family transcriptional regulator [Planctomycetota bacterium]
MSRSHHLGELQLAIIRILWEQGEATVAQVHQVLHSDGGRALTTIATMLKKMEKKDVVRHRLDGRQFVYQATVSESQVRNSMVSELTERLFQGDVAALVNHLIADERVDGDELAKLKRLISQAEQRSQEKA